MNTQETARDAGRSDGGFGPLTPDDVAGIMDVAKHIERDAAIFGCYTEIDGTSYITTDYAKHVWNASRKHRDAEIADELKEIQRITFYDQRAERIDSLIEQLREGTK